MKPKQAIYETKGRAREFAELALNHFSGCGHSCLYCYAPMAVHKDRAAFHGNPHPRLTPEQIEDSAIQWQTKGERRPVLLSFTTDPYQPVEAETQLTRHAINALHLHNLSVIILTKGGRRSTRDFDMLGPGDQYATTLTLFSEMDSKRWEPGAAPPSERIAALLAAKELGIQTWASLEPVIDPEQTKTLVELTHSFVGHYKLGTLNYHPHGKTIDWNTYGNEMWDYLDNLSAKFYFKNDLVKAMGYDPATFPQTWRCQ